MPQERPLVVLATVLELERGASDEVFDRRGD